MKVLIPQYSYGNIMPLLSRFTDDNFAVVIFGGDDGLTADECGTNSRKTLTTTYGILRWNLKEVLLKVIYIDLATQLENGHFVTPTYQKLINLCW